MKKNRTDKRMKALSEKIRMLRVQKNLTQKTAGRGFKAFTAVNIRIRERECDSGYPVPVRIRGIF